MDHTILTHTTKRLLQLSDLLHKFKMGFLPDPRSSRTSTGVASLFLFCCLSIFLVQSSIAGVIDLKWTVEYMHWSPDCIESVVMGINGNFPGPTITATAADLINIELTNHLHTEVVVIHWHGITQAILINGRGQYACSAAAHFDGKAVCSPKCKPEPLKVEPGKTYRIRLASTTALSSLNFMIQDHKLDVVEADGNYVERFSVDDLDIYSGESYSVLLRTKEDAKGNYWISIGVRGRDSDTPPALTILNYLPTEWEKHPNSAPPLHPKWNNYTHSKSFSNKIKALNAPKLEGYSYKPPPEKQNRRIVLLNTQNTIKERTKWTINDISLTLPSTPYLGAIKYSLDKAFDQQSLPDRYSNPDYDIMVPPLNTAAISSSAVYNLPSDETIDVILQNANMLKDDHSEIHPWHLHGHDFWVLGYGEGKFIDAEHEGKFNLVDPPLRNTVVVYPYGWTALRFKTDNPGVWAFHCHIEPHLHMGMGVIFAEGIEEIKKMSINKKALVCGLTGEKFMDSYKE